MMSSIAASLKRVAHLVLLVCLAVFIPLLSLWGHLQHEKSEEAPWARAMDLMKAHPVLCLIVGAYGALCLAYAAKSAARAVRHVRNMRSEARSGDWPFKLLLFHLADGMLLIHLLGPLNLRVISHFLSQFTVEEGTPLWQGLLLASSGLDSILVAAALVNLGAGSWFGSAALGWKNDSSKVSR